VCPPDDFVAEITRLCHGAIACYGDPVVRESIPGLLVDLRRSPDAPVAQRPTRGHRAGRLAARLDDEVANGIARRSSSADTVLT